MTVENKPKKLMHILIPVVVRGTLALGSFVFSVLVARVAGAQGAGAVFTSLAILTGLSLIARFGQDLKISWSIGAILARGGTAKDTTGILGRSILLTLLASLIILTLWHALNITGILYSQNSATHWVLDIVLLSLPAHALGYIFAGCFKAVGRASVSMVLEQGGLYTLAVILIIIARVFYAEAWQEYIPQSVVLASYAVLLFGTVAWTGLKPARNEIKEISIATDDSQSTTSYILSAFNMCIPFLANYVIHWGGLIFVGLIINESAAGIFGAAERLAMIQTFILSVILATSVKEISLSGDKRDIPALREIAQRTSFYATSGAFPILILLALFPEWFIGIFGTAFSQHYSILVTLALAHFLIITLGSSGLILMSIGRESSLSRIHLQSAGIAIIMNLTLVPMMEIQGAALALLVTFGYQYYATNRLCKKALGTYTLPIPISNGAGG